MLNPQKGQVWVFFAAILVSMGVILALLIQIHHLNQPTIRWYTSLGDAKVEAKHVNQQILVYFYAEDCFFCKKMEAETFTHPSVIRVINDDYIAVKMPLSENLAGITKYHIANIPAILIIDTQDHVLDTLYGDIEPSKLSADLSAKDLAYHNSISSSSVSPSDNPVFATLPTNGECKGNVCPVPAPVSASAPVSKSSILVSMLIFLGMGAAASFTPCYFVLLLLVASFIAGRSIDLSYHEKIILPLVFTTALSLSYGIVGVLSAVIGAYIPAYTGNIWVILLFAALFVLLALSQLGVYSIHLPNQFSHYVVQFNKRKAEYSYLEVIMMGVVVTLIALPCAAAPILGLLTYVGYSRDILLGGLSLFAFGVGVCFPLLVAAIFGARCLPANGEWNQKVKTIFGLTLLGIAIWLVNQVLPFAFAYLTWGLFLLWACYFYIQKYSTAFAWWLRTLLFLLVILGAILVYRFFTL